MSFLVGGVWEPPMGAIHVYHPGEAGGALRGRQLVYVPAALTLEGGP